MKNVIEITFHLPVQIVKKERWHVASCEVFDVYSQGDSQEQAKQNLAEALTLFLSSCFERGTLDAVLKECGFHPQHAELRPEGDVIDVPLHLLQSPAYSAPCHA